MILALMAPPGKLRRRKEGDSPDSSGEAGTDLLVGEENPKSKIVCGGCGHVVSTSEQCVEIDGRHQHTCVNPAGFVFHIRCFGFAPGCVGEGDWTDFYSWFAGYLWQISLCGHCAMHLGWAFRGEGKPDFHGLIIDRIEERDA